MRCGREIGIGGALLLCLAGSLPGQQLQRRGIALLLGNFGYDSGALSSVEPDLNLMAEVLQRRNFAVRKRENLDTPEDFKDAVAHFIEEVNANTDDTLIVLYSGHGMQFEGSTYMLGVHYSREHNTQEIAAKHAYSIDALLRQVELAEPRARVVWVDACRNNAVTSQSVTGAFAPGATGVHLGPQDKRTVVLFSDQPGKTVPDRKFDLGSPFIRALAEAMARPNQGIEEIFETAREITGKISEGQVPDILHTTPWEATILSDTAQIDTSGRDAALLNKANEAYQNESWPLYIDILTGASQLKSLSATLAGRIAKELEWAQIVEEAEMQSASKNYSAAAVQWRKASVIFPGRLWTTERAAVATLQDDRREDAIPALLLLSRADPSPAAARAAKILSSLFESDSSLRAIEKQHATDEPLPSGMEFEPFSIR
jgi:Caspase domain